MGCWAEGGVVFLLADDRKMKSGVRETDSLLSIFFSFPCEGYPVISPPRNIYLNTYRKVKFFHFKFTMKFKVTEVQVTTLTHYHKTGCWILNKQRLALERCK